MAPIQNPVYSEFILRKQFCAELHTENTIYSHFCTCVKTHLALSVICSPALTFGAGARYPYAGADTFGEEINATKATLRQIYSNFLTRQEALAGLVDDVEDEKCQMMIFS